MKCLNDNEAPRISLWGNPRELQTSLLVRCMIMATRHGAVDDSDPDGERERLLRNDILTRTSDDQSGYRVYPTRWYILATVCVLNISNSMASLFMIIFPVLFINNQASHHMHYQNQNRPQVK